MAVVFREIETLVAGSCVEELVEAYLYPRPQSGIMIMCTLNKDIRTELRTQLFSSSDRRHGPLLLLQYIAP